MEIHDRPSVRLRLKVRMLKVEVLETLLYGCVTWSPSKANYGRRRKAHHQMLLRCLGWPKRKREDHILSCANALLRTDSESVETTVYEGYCSRASWHALEKSACRGGLCLRRYSGIQATPGDRGETG